MENRVIGNDYKCADYCGDLLVVVYCLCGCWCCWCSLGEDGGAPFVA